MNGNVSKKTYYSKYVVLPNLTFPTVITQIAYDSKGDSIVKKEEYKNIRTKDFPDESLFNYRVPKGAKLVSPFIRSK